MSNPRAGRGELCNPVFKALVGDSRPVQWSEDGVHICNRWGTTSTAVL